MPVDPPTPESDLRLVRQVLAGDAQALDALVERLKCVPRILAAQNARGGRPLDDPDLADLSQDTLVLVWRKLREFEGRSELTGWVYRMCVLQFLNAVRRKRRRHDLRLDRVPEGTRRVEDPQEYDDLYLGLERVHREDAEVIRLKHFEDLSFEAVAQRLGQPTSSVKSRYYRGIGHLGDFLRARDEEVTR